MVDDLLGEEIDWPLGPGVWDGMCVLHEHPELDEMTPGELYGIIPVELCGWRVDEAVVRMYLDDETVKEATEEELSALERGEDVSRPNGLSLLFTLMKREVGDTSFEGWMRQLLSGDVDERKRLAEAAGGNRAAIARISVQWPAPIVLHRYAYARGEELFDVFDRLDITLYHDFESFTLNSVPCRCDGITIRGFFRTLCLDEQWALGVADDHYLSDELRAGLASWKRRYDACVVSEDASMEDLLARFLRLMSGAWECHPVDTSFVDVMRTHADDERYLRLATIMVDVALEGTETVPELMQWQAITWVLKRERGEYFPRLLSTFAGLVANADLVRQVFGIGD